MGQSKEAGEFRQLAEIIATEAALAGESDDPHEWEMNVVEIEGDLRGVYMQGAAVAFGLMGMAGGIQANGPRLVEREYWTNSQGERLYNCFCPGCGAYMKARSAGVHEGTDLEWCGVCRDSL